MDEANIHMRLLRKHSNMQLVKLTRDIHYLREFDCAVVIMKMCMKRGLYPR